eukprot:gene40919-50625_t
MFCGETPKAVAIKLSRCARCKEVAYCGKVAIPPARVLESEVEEEEVVLTPK